MQTAWKIWPRRLHRRPDIPPLNNIVKPKRRAFWARQLSSHLPWLTPGWRDVAVLLARVVRPYGQSWTLGFARFHSYVYRPCCRRTHAKSVSQVGCVAVRECNSPAWTFVKHVVMISYSLDLLEPCLLVMYLFCVVLNIMPSSVLGCTSVPIVKTNLSLSSLHAFVIDS